MQQIQHLATQKETLITHWTWRPSERLMVILHNYLEQLQSAFEKFVPRHLHTDSLTLWHQQRICQTTQTTRYQQYKEKYPILNILKFLPLTSLTNVRHNLGPMTKHFLWCRKYRVQIQTCIFKSLKHTATTQPEIHRHVAIGHRSDESNLSQISGRLHPGLIQHAGKTHQQCPQHRKNVYFPHNTETGFMHQLLYLDRIQTKRVLHSSFPRRVSIKSFNQILVRTTTAHSRRTRWHNTQQLTNH